MLTLLWLRTTMNFQYKHGGSFCAALSYLYKEGGVGRLYAGTNVCLVCVSQSASGWPAIHCLRAAHGFELCAMPLAPMSFASEREREREREREKREK